jgi:hypothetical protein
VKESMVVPFWLDKIGFWEEIRDTHYESSHNNKE